MVGCGQLAARIRTEHTAASRAILRTMNNQIGEFADRTNNSKRKRHRRIGELQHVPPMLHPCPAARYEAFGNFRSSEAPCCDQLGPERMAYKARPAQAVEQCPIRRLSPCRQNCDVHQVAQVEAASPIVSIMKLV